MGKLDTAILHWENSLLDLGKRNRMINYPIAPGKRRSQQTLRLMEPGYADIYDTLVHRRKALTIQQPPVEKFDLRCEAMLRLFERLNCPIAPMQGELRPEGSFSEYRKILKNMRAKMKLAREEQGTHVLYLAVGFLDWKQLTGKLEALTSPLLLVPVRLTMKSIRAPYVLDMPDEDVVVNPALDQLFRMEYGLELPPLDDQNLPVDAYLDRVEALARAHGWAVRRECHLALLSFQKISMYHDLKRSHERIAQNAVLRAISGEEAYPLDASVMDGVNLDAIPPQESHLVVGADASQQYAIELSRRGVSFCLQGPPGGGKSQTITNIIAQAMADGKKVLFVAEKMAALDVVHRRLKDAGLGEFTLALHSHRADRRAILSEISQPLQLTPQALDANTLAGLDEVEALRRSLNVYPVLLHRRREPLCESLYSVLGELAKLAEAPLVMAELSGAESISRSALTEEIARVAQLSRAFARYETLPDNPWRGLQGAWSTFMARTQLNNEAAAALQSAQALRPVAEKLAAAGFLKAGQEIASLTALEQIFAAAKQVGPVSDAWASAAEEVSRLAAKARDYAARADAARARAGKVLLPGAKVDETALTRLTALYSDLQAVLTGTRWQTQTDAFATHYIALAPAVRRITESAQRALNLLGCSESTGREADWALDAAAALAAVPADQTDLPSDAANDPLLARVHAVREKAAQLLQQIPGVLGGMWQPQALTLDAAGLLRRFHNDYSGLSRMMNLSRYNQDMRTLGGVYCGRARLDDGIAKAFLTRLASWQTGRQSWSREAYAITQQLNLPAMGPDGPWESIEKQLTALAALGRCADTAAHRQLLLDALAHPDVRRQAAAITENLRYAMFDQSLRSADWAGDALSDNLHHTLRGILAAAEDLTELRAILDALRPACAPEAALPDMLSALQDEVGACRCRTLLEETLTHLQPLTGGRPLITAADFASLAADAQTISAAMAQAEALPDGLAAALLTGARPLPEIALTAPQQEAIAVLVAFSARFEAADAPICMPFAGLCARLERCLQHPEALDLWLEWRDAHNAMAGTLFAAFAEAAQLRQLPHDQWADAANKLFLCTWVEYVLDGEHLLSLFRAHVHEESIRRFGTLDDKQLHIARQRIRQQLIAVVPDEKHRALSATDELAILQRELMKKRGRMPLRQLFGKIPNLLTTLKPCLMMSPLSVASFLENEAISFDLVIFDEASQIMPENAIGAMLRGKQVIITGDTKQMPPTDFFTVSVGAHDYDPDDEEALPEDDIAPEESILEQCAAVLPSCPLLWHYRSRHESLIAFSNREIYAGRLITFPGSIEKQPHLGVELIHVPDGVFIKRRNKPEARRCVELIEDHIRHRAHRSLGVVAFSRTQQSAIEEELHRFRMAHPEYDDFFDEGRDEPFFIKNLENVQGDERDTMIFSVGYAPRGDGKPMSLNLGPLSASGGERRLNVAITRARCNVKLVTSILAKDIDLSRTASEGTRLLRAYIDYAEKGYTAIADGHNAPAPDAFAAHLAAVLEKAGYQVAQNVGCSGCRIDVAIRHPADSTRYALGVLTDGPAYAAQATCRDRDKLQSSVLEGMGWQLHRVWAADWLQRPDQVERELLAAAQRAVSAPIPDLAAAPEEIAAPDALPAPADVAALPAAEAPDALPAPEEVPHLPAPDAALTLPAPVSLTPAPEVSHD